MRYTLAALFSLTAVACGGPRPEMLKERDLEGAYEAFRSNIAAIHRRDTEAYLAHYLESPELVVASADSLRRGFVLFAEARRASEDWPDTLIAGQPVLVWLGPGLVWGAYEYTVVQGGDTAWGWSDRVFVKTGGGWKIAVTGTRQR
jgi:hypothetical protein